MIPNAESHNLPAARTDCSSTGMILSRYPLHIAALIAKQPLLSFLCKTLVPYPSRFISDRAIPSFVATLCGCTLILAEREDIGYPTSSHMCLGLRFATGMAEVLVSCDPIGLNPLYEMHCWLDPFIDTLD